MAKKCEMIIGYLVPHSCENPALGVCVKCGRGFCEEHTHATAEGRVCLACQQGLAMPVALPIMASTFTPADVALFGASTLDDTEDAGDMFSDLS